jgi:hypothetical protein
MTQLLKWIHVTLWFLIHFTHFYVCTCMYDWLAEQRDGLISRQWSYRGVHVNTPGVFFL